MGVIGHVGLVGGCVGLACGVIGHVGVKLFTIS